jgi:hypothetical protein
LKNGEGGKMNKIITRAIAGLIPAIILTLGLMLPLIVETNGWAADSLTGKWYGTWYLTNSPGTGICDVSIDQDDNSAIVNVPALGLFDFGLPATFGDGSIIIGSPLYGLYFDGTVTDDSLSGLTWQYIGDPINTFVPIADWQIFKEMGETEPDSPPGPLCDDLPPLYCKGDAEHCSELLPFDPDMGPGYLDYPLNGETWEDQYRSYTRRDLMMLVKYAAAKAECKTADWDYWNFAPLGLGDMSEADGNIPGTSIGYPGHPPGTHEYGNDIDIAYFQLYATDNFLRPICSSYDSYFDTGHCVEPPYALDRWRTALFISYISEHPLVRIIYVDWLVGPILDDTLDEMVSLGWIDAEHRAAISLVYYVEGEEEEEYLFHHHHLHISMNPFYDILSMFDLKPETLNRKSNGRYITGYIELVEGLDVSQIEVSTVALIVDGHTTVPAEADQTEVADYNGNGIPDLVLKFDRQSVLEAIDESTVEIAITGNINGMFFQGSDMLLVK